LTFTFGEFESKDCRLKELFGDDPQRPATSAKGGVLGLDVLMMCLEVIGLHLSDLVKR
jgi:hypothetical protein